MCFAYVGWMFLFWIPTYLVEARGYPLGIMGILGIPLQGSAFIGLVGGGMLGDWLLRRGWSSQFVRARMGGSASRSHSRFSWLAPWFPPPPSA